MARLCSGRASAADDQRPGNRQEQDVSQLLPRLLLRNGLGVRRRIQTQGLLRGRYGWSAGQGTNLFVDQDGTVGIVCTRVQMGERMWPLLEEFQALNQPT
jgi:hypothetical protein